MFYIITIAQKAEFISRAENHHLLIVLTIITSSMKGNGRRSTDEYFKYRNMIHIHQTQCK